MHAPTQRASVRLCTAFSCAGRQLSRGAGRAAYKGVQRAENDVSETHTTGDVPPAKC